MYPATEYLEQGERQRVIRGDQVNATYINEDLTRYFEDADIELPGSALATVTSRLDTLLTDGESLTMYNRGIFALSSNYS